MICEPRCSAHVWEFSVLGKSQKQNDLKINREKPHFCQLRAEMGHGESSVRHFVNSLETRNSLFETFQNLSKPFDT